MELEYGAMMEPLSVAVHSVANMGQMKAGYSVLVFGAGPVGLLAMGVAKGLGAAKIIAVDINEERLNFAKGYAATHTYIPVSGPSFLFLSPSLVRPLSVDWNDTGADVTRRVSRKTERHDQTTLSVPPRSS